MQQEMETSVDIYSKYPDKYQDVYQCSKGFFDLFLVPYITETFSQHRDSYDRYFQIILQKRRDQMIHDAQDEERN